MRWLALLLMAPTFAVLGWLYWQFPRELPRSAARRRFDAGALLLATLLAVGAMLFAVTQRPAGSGPIWPQVYAVLAVYHVYPVVLALAWWVRRRRFAQRQSPDATNGAQ